MQFIDEVRQTGTIDTGVLNFNFEYALGVEQESVSLAQLEQQKQDLLEEIAGIDEAIKDIKAIK